MHFFLMVLVLGSLLAACSGDKPKRLGPEDVTVEELRALIPVDLVPAGFTQEGPSPNAPPVPTPAATHFEVLFRHDAGGIIAIGVFADGKGSLGDPVGDICRNWQAYTKTKDCPVKKETAAAVGQQAMAYSSGPDPDGKTMHTTIFVRDGIRVGVGVLAAPTESGLLDMTASFLKAIDERIKALAEAKLNAK